MLRQDAERIIAEYVKPVFGFALKRCKTAEDAEDLSQEIILRAFRSLLVKDDIDNNDKFIWTVAHNTLANYYRSSARMIVGVPIDEMAEMLSDGSDVSEGIEAAETEAKLHREIAYLSKLQRQIVIQYYYENRRQTDIAESLGIPLGTVKWHLFEAKKELKRGMETMRNPSELKFNPVKFESYGINGSVGTKKLEEFFRSALSQNICYCVRNEAKTVGEIADALGVSPVYVETEVDFLETYGFLKAQKDKYIVNFIISEPTAELLTMQDTMYKKAAGIFANELYDELIESGLVDHHDIWCNQTDGPISFTETAKADRNFILWSLIPYIAAVSGEELMDDRISFEEVATIRPDGSHNICHASVVPDNMILPEDYVYMKNWCGPFTHQGGAENIGFWQIDTEWSESRIGVNKSDTENVDRVISLFKRSCDGDPLSEDEYAWLAEHGYVKTYDNHAGEFKVSWQIVILGNREIKDKLLAIGGRIKEKYKEEFDAIKVSYIEAVLKSVPAHLKKVKAYELQFVFHSDGWFILHCLKNLVNSGKLKEPTEEQRKSLSMLIIENK
ncbi:MAG: RNA polymerase sigma factor [Ruminococcaceae bacterium]|nr:RNA polymerase sigma factor [Oscillospiraceae bacterium]